MSEPIKPPTAPPTPNPARPAMIGPAAMKGPTPGIANIPTPASRPSAPPRTAPAPAPAAAPSGALVAFSVAIGREPRFSGSRAEISEGENPDFINLSVAESAADTD